MDSNWNSSSQAGAAAAAAASGGGPAPGGDANNASLDWRVQLQPDARQRIVNKIMDTLKRHLPLPVPEGLSELQKIAVRFEEKIYSAATSQPDYLRNISLKMVSMETKSQPGGMNAPAPLANQNLNFTMRSFPEALKVGSSFIYGRADDVKKIIDLLSLEDVSDHDNTVISIIADRGTGRTTLLHLLYSELGNAFDIIKFVCMPEKFDEKGLMRLIIESLTEFPCDITNLDVLEEIVKEEIKDKRLLLLLDNFENKNQNCWDLLIALLNVCKDKSAIVVTATREAVANVKGPMQFYYMNNLSNKWCWTIFEEAVFSGENQNTVSVLADVGKLLVAKCRNVTLCIKVLSGLLRHSITDKWWRDVLDNKFWEMDGDTLPALRVCYEYLPSYLKQCFKYCSLFPKEYIFSKQHLVRLWLSQGFIEAADGRELEDIGAEYFDHFLSLSFFQPSLFPGQTEDRFVMAGLIHGLALCFSKNECFQFDGCVQRAPENASHLSLVPHEFQSVSLSQIIPRDQNLQTLSVASRAAFHNQSISSSIINLVDLKDLIGEFHSLITLDLNNSDIEELPESFGSLTNLRYLSLSSTRIKKIPLEISKLIHLQTLEAKDCHYLEELPRSIEALTDLRYLDVTKEVGYVVMPHGIGNLTHLRNLATFNVGKDALVHCGIEELKDMVLLKGCLQISGLVNVRSASDVNRAHMRSKEYIETICFNWSDGMSSLEGDKYVEIAEEVLESLHPTNNLKEIIIRGYPGNSFPKWIECVAFTRLLSVIFDHCYNCKNLPALCGLPSLRFLSIQKMFGIERMNLSGLEFTLENIVIFPSLEQLSIWEMYELVEWVELEYGSFPVLHSLSINRCPFLRNIPKFPALVELSVYSCAQFVKEMELPSLQSLRIEGLQKTKFVGLSKNLVGLEKLEFSHCPELLSIEGLSLLNSLETIIISGCPQFDFDGALDVRQFTLDEKGSRCSVWSRKKTLAFDNLNLSGSSMRDEGQDQPIALKKRKDRNDLSSLSGVLAEGHKKIKELGSRFSKQDQELIESTIERLVETVQNSMANLIPAIRTAERSSNLGSNMPLELYSEPSSSVGILAQPSIVTGMIDPHTEGSEHLKKVSRVRKRTPQEMRKTIRARSLEDGHTWRKYGQKSVLGCKSSRSYFRCAHKYDQGCLATKQVQRLDEDPSIFEITYQGSHTCSQNRAEIPVVLPQERRSAPDNPAYFSFSSSSFSRSETVVSDLTALGSIDQPSTLTYPIEKMHDTTLSLSLPSSVAISDPVESQAAFSSYNSSFAARSETEVSDITALCSVDSRQAYHSGFGSELDDSE